MAARDKGKNQSRHHTQAVKADSLPRPRLLLKSQEAKLAPVEGPKPTVFAPK